MINLLFQPSSFMQNMPLEQIISTQTLSAPYTSTVLQGFLDLNDLAEIARLVIEDPETHNRARYELVGENCTLADVAQKVSSFIGKEVNCKQAPRSEMVSRIRAESDYAKEALDRMLYYYDRR